MRIGRITPNNFCAKYISSQKAEIMDFAANTYKPCEVSFLLLDKDNPKDLTALRPKKEEWEIKDGYVDRIINSAECIFAKRPYSDKARVYIISSQSGNFENLDESKILGLAAVRERVFDMYLNYIQVDPNNHIYNKVGSAMLDGLKGEYDCISLMSKAGVEGFYEANDFYKGSVYEGQYCWKRLK